jgi:hypothetical protein
MTWIRVKGKLGSGRELEQSTLQLPGAYPQSGGTIPLPLTFSSYGPTLGWLDCVEASTFESILRLFAKDYDLRKL